MKFSIIIPCYKQAEYLPQAIESALNQTYKNAATATEIIVINDGSSDTTQEVAESYPVKLITQTNKGLASARNAGIMNATGDYVLPLDADDILEPSCVETMSEIAASTNADIIAPSIHCFGKADQNVILMDAPTFEDFKFGNRIPYCSAVKRDALLEIGGYSPKMDTLGGWEDLHLWYALLLRNKQIVTTQDILVNYRTKESSMWTQAERNSYSLWEQIVKDFPETSEHVPKS